MNTNKRKYNTRRSLRNTTMIQQIENRLDNDILINVIKIMKICFSENYKFSYNIVQENNDELRLELDINDGIPSRRIQIIDIYDEPWNKYALLIGKIYINSEDGMFTSKINMVKSNLGYLVGTFLLNIFMYISILIGVDNITLENDTNNPLRAAKGIYGMFDPVNEYDDDEIYNRLKYYFDNYDELDTISEGIHQNDKLRLEIDELFMTIKKQYDNFNDVPTNLKKDLLLQEILRLNDGMMIYKVTPDSLIDIKNKIYQIIMQMEIIDDTDNPWNKNVYKQLKKKKIIGGKKIQNKKYKTKKYKTKKYKTKKYKTKRI